MDINVQMIKNNINRNLYIIEEVLEKEEKNKNKIYDNKEENNIKQVNNNINIIIKKENEIDNNNQMLDIINDNKEKNQINNETRNNNTNEFNNYLNQNTNNTNENIINKYNSINLEYSEDKKTDEEKEEKKIDDIKIENKNIINNNENKLLNFISNKKQNSKRKKVEENSIKNNDSIHYLDLDNITTGKNKKIFDSNNPNNKLIYNNVQQSIYDNLKKNKSPSRNLINAIDISGTKDKNKGRIIKNEKTNINLKKNIIYESNRINLITLANNQKNNLIYSQKKCFLLFIGRRK